MDCAKCNSSRRNNLGGKAIEWWASAIAASDINYYNLKEKHADLQ